MQIKELEYNIGLPSPAEDFEDFALSEGRKLIPTFNATGTKASDPD
jgi:hypothetical protein